MAKANRNVITQNYRGKVGNVILRMVGGMSILSAYPDYSKRKWSKLQKENRAKFKKAAIYSKNILKIPERARFYQSKARGLQNAGNMAVSDYMLHPEIREVDVSKYKGQAGNAIKVSAYDRYMVASVIVMILNAGGFVVESGMAMEYPYGGSGKWVYKAQVPNDEWKGGKVVVRVTDLPGKVVSAIQRLDGT